MADAAVFGRGAAEAPDHEAVAALPVAGVGAGQEQVAVFGREGEGDLPLMPQEALGVADAGVQQRRDQARQVAVLQIGIRKGHGADAQEHVPLPGLFGFRGQHRVHGRIARAGIARIQRQGAQQVGDIGGDARALVQLRQAADGAKVIAELVPHGAQLRDIVGSQAAADKQQADLIEYDAQAHGNTPFELWKVSLQCKHTTQIRNDQAKRRKNLTKMKKPRRLFQQNFCRK